MLQGHASRVNVIDGLFQFGNIQLTCFLVLSRNIFVLPAQLELRYGMPQLQIPVELVILHLAMLAFLERYQVRECTGTTVEEMTYHTPPYGIQRMWKNSW